MAQKSALLDWLNREGVDKDTEVKIADVARRLKDDLGEGVLRGRSEKALQVKLLELRRMGQKKARDWASVGP